MRTAGSTVVATTSSARSAAINRRWCRSPLCSRPALSRLGWRSAAATARSAWTAARCGSPAATIAASRAAATVPASAGFAVRAGLSLCGAIPTEPLPKLLRVAPSGGVSNCWTPRVEEDSAADPMFAPLRQAMLTAETLLKQNAAFMSAPVPVRMRTSLSAGPARDGGARMHVKAVPERKADGTRLWTKECGVIPQVDRIGGAITQISVFFNVGADGLFLNSAWRRAETDGTRRWISRVRRLGADHQGRPAPVDSAHARRPPRGGRSTPAQRRSTTGTRPDRQTKPPDPAAIQKTFEMLEKTDPAGAAKFMQTMTEQAEEVKRLQQDVYPATTASLEQQVSEFEKYRASFTPEQLRSPAVTWRRYGHGEEASRRRDRCDPQDDAEPGKGRSAHFSGQCAVRPRKSSARSGGSRHQFQA